MNDLNNNTQAASNPASQTLFRFVSLRNPELAKREGNTKFIFRPEEYTGVFDDLLNSWNSASGQSKIDFLTEKIKSNAPGIDNIRKTEKEIKDHFDWFYEFSKDLIADGSLDSTKVAAINAGVPDPFLVWDSLIYQVLVQKDFYVKELLTQMLQTLHYAKNYTTFSTEPVVKKKLIQQKEVATAKVVLPESLFIDSVPVGEQTTVFTVGSSAVGSNDPISSGTSGDISSNNAVQNVSYFPDESVLKRQKVAVALYEKKQLDDLKKELTKAQTLYNKQYTKAYDLASKDYQALIKPLYDSYEQNLLEVEATFTEEMTEAAKKLALSQVAKPEIPDFEFEFRAERDVAFLQNKLSEASLESFVSLIGEYANPDTITGRLNNGDVLPENIVEIGEEQYILPADENQNFVELLETIDEKLSALNDEILQNTEVEKQEYVSVGGILIPAKTSIVETPFTYHICAVKNINTATKYNFDLQLNMPDSGWDITQIYYDMGGNTGGYYEKATSGNTIFLKNLYNNSPNIYGIEASLFPITLEIHLFFTNGKTSVFKTSAMQLGTCVSGSFSVDGVTDPSDSNTPTNITDSFIPKGFGIKRLGIADYLKVEQSTHAYVEGEVANIENIMAREYREKSTRRLRRSEITETISSDTEREQLTDTTTASRFEMQSEVAKIVQETTSLEAHTSFSYGPDKMRFEIGGSYANNRSKEDSMRQAVTQAQDVTSRALDRVVTKVHQERIEKIIEEFEENNSHGFDNRKGDKHVVGVYRWVDKLMKNQVWNYGKRLMFEFAIPQPAKLHLLAMNSREKIAGPVDPRKQEGIYNLSNFANVNSETIKYWSGFYNVEIENLSLETIKVTKAFAYGRDKVTDVTSSDTSAVGIQDVIKIPEGYVSTQCSISGGGKQYLKDGQSLLNINIGDKQVIVNDPSGTFSVSNLLSGYTEELAIGISTDRFYSFETVVTIVCQLSDNATKQWQQKTFNTIIEAYEDAMVEYNNKVAEEETKANNIKGSNPLFYRQIEQEVLKHNCIAYLTDDKSKTKNIGTKMYTGDQLLDFKVDRTDIDEYTSFAKFMEQAFEWDIMSYNLYPYYWGNKTEWGSMYVSENADPLFRSFLRSGMARVVVTVRPGFEDAVQFYMATGRLWNGGEVPVIGDPMYLSIVDELKDIKGETQGKPWITRIPTSLTILQAQNIGLEVQHALPFTKEDPLDFENPEEVITESNFYPSDDQMEAEKGKLVENIEINNDYLQLTNNDNPHQVIAQLSLDDLKQALE
ncbi:MAG: hypothetical protein DI529_00295 [Chryseobacterium sp.]|nr:MAG: hypothetical protein DI529_00295 [Chryseobacterium sp.]